MNKNHISIGITAYREGLWLQEAWNSVLKQDDTRWEAIMVLDGNADIKTKTIFDNIRHPRLIKIRLETNIGPYPARTLAINKCNTPWYLHLDADDKLPLNVISLINKALEKNQSPDFIYGNIVFFDEQGHLREEKSRWDIEKIAIYQCIPATSPFKIEYFKKAGAFATEFSYGGADHDFWISMAEKKAQGVYLNAILYERRKRKGSVGNNWPYDPEKYAEILIQRHPHFYAQGERKKNFLAFTWAKMAKNHRWKNRKKAGFYAKKALEAGHREKALSEISEEASILWFRYKLRHLSRLFIKIFRKLLHGYA
jgi:glycosyltransferase involved in cell wall biosynthesis